MIDMIAIQLMNTSSMNIEYPPSHHRPKPGSANGHREE